MTKERPANGFWSYVAECLRLLYWAYFKPFTFKSWLRDIHPELKPTDNPFSKRGEFRTNPRLRRYAGQVWWLGFSISLLSVMLMELVLFLATGKPIDCLSTGLLILGYGSGLWLIVRFVSLLPSIPLLSCMMLLLAVGIIVDELIGAQSGFAYLVAYGTSCGIMACVISIKVGWASKHNINFGILYSLAIGVPAGIKLGVASGVVYSLTFGTAYTLGLLRFYLWVPEFLWMLVIYALSRFGNQVRWLRYLPPRFDELIILPLPFMRHIIIEAYRENPAAARQTVYYLVTSTNQATVALQVMEGIAVDSFNRCQLLSDIADIAEQLSWIPLPSSRSEDLDSMLLPLLVYVSQGVRASQQATSSYRQYELLNPPISALHTLQNNIAFTKDTLIATTFGRITKRWLTILETAQCVLEQQVQYSQEIPPVYIAGPALDPERAKNRFKGRIDLFREIENQSLSDQPPVLLLYGGRRTGKTSALKYLPYRVGGNVVPLLIDLQGAASATTLKGLAENLTTQIIEAARRLPRFLYLTPPNADKLAEDPFPALQNWLGEIERKAPDKRFILCLDEFERLSEVVETTGSRAPLNFLRNVLQHQHKWTLLFSGSHQLSELPPYWSDYLINTRALRITYLQESEARELILQPVEDFPKIYEPGAVDAIIQLTRCQPYLVQLVCYEVVELLNRDIRGNRRDAGTAKATVEDVHAVIPTVLERGDQYFRELWTSLEDSDRTLLRCVVQGETPTAQHKKVVRKLVQKEILEKEGNAFQVPLVQRFVEQVVEEDS
jgi:AAA+ ATPase superfamily predicted ATPase